jgi:hypothetical protein
MKPDANSPASVVMTQVCFNGVNVCVKRRAPSSRFCLDLKQPFLSHTSTEAFTSRHRHRIHRMAPKFGGRRAQIIFSSTC